MYAALTHTLDSVSLGCIDVQCAVETRPLSLLERAKLNCQRAQALADIEACQPPWRFLSERHSILEAECERRCRAIAGMSNEQFLSQLLQPSTCGNLEGVPAAFADVMLPVMLPVGHSALQEAPDLDGMRRRLVPAICTDVAWWYCFFKHCEAVKAQLLPPNPVIRSASDERRADDDDFERFLASPLPTSWPTSERHLGMNLRG